MDVFHKCFEINELITNGDETGARNEIIKLLDYCQNKELPLTPLINNLIRQVGLYPYLQIETSAWQDRFIYEAFKVNVGEKKQVTLHREQSAILKKLINGKNLAVSAPTSFGKSFIIDAFIAIKKPKNVVIIVPTIALTDETRRRLHKKFSGKYKVITTTEIILDEYNIFIFPQERAIHYVNKLDEIDMLIVDEFYKASSAFDKERSPALINAIIKLGSKAKQKYFLAPNISTLKDNFFTKGMDFVSVDFNTVFLEHHKLYENINGDELLKSEALLKILDNANGKTLIYAGTFPNISNISTLIIDQQPVKNKKLLVDFHAWLSKNYDSNWQLTKLIKRETGLHNGRLHRSLSQIQIRLFEEPDGIKNLVSTSSIIEGVNTSAENVVLWSNKSGRGRAKINDFSYRNIIGRGGRMFRHFVGKIYILEKPPENEDIQLNLTFPDELIGSIDLDEFKSELSKEQISKIIAYREEMDEFLGDGGFEKLQLEGRLESSNSFLIRDIAKEIYSNRQSWRGLGYLNSNHPDDWEGYLYKVIKLSPGGWGAEYNKIVAFVKIISKNWMCSIPELLEELNDYDIGIEQFFELERNVTFKLASLLNDVNIIQEKILKEGIDISPFIKKVSNAFLPPIVYQLEEYGLPRMLSRVINNSNIIILDDKEKELHDILANFVDLSKDNNKLDCLFDSFDKYIFKYFIDGVLTDEDNHVII
ncbi:TPA: DEAD/DEAH box helicase [Escherichia coli]|nr:DEAD/DEAH box helicase [Escherichia coli]